MVGAIVRNNIVENLIIVNDSQVETMSKVLNCEIVDAVPYGLDVGDLRTPVGWTRNVNGEQKILSLLAVKRRDSYSTVAKKNVELSEAVIELEKNVESAAADGAEGAVTEMLAILSGEVEA